MKDRIGKRVKSAERDAAVPCELASQMVSTRLYPAKVVVVADDAVVASYERLGAEGQTCYGHIDRKGQPGPSHRKPVSLIDNNRVDPGVVAQSKFDT